MTNKGLMALQIAQWTQIGALHQELATHSLTNPETSFLYILESISELLDATSTFAICAHRAPQHDHLMGWRPTHFTYINPTAHDARLAQLLTAHSKRMDEKSADPWLSAHIPRVGAHRAYTWDMLVPDVSFREQPGYDKLYLATQTIDRLFGVFHMCDDMEIYFCVDRCELSPPFTPAQCDALLYLLPSLAPFIVRHYGMCGLLPDHTPLTPREKETLQHLLSGISEKEIAQAMGLTHRSAHQYITTIYRKLQVNSRAKLMALWLSPPYRESLNNQGSQ
jgi:DNA-binding CsgD family transcriptional regulator